MQGWAWRMRAGVIIHGYLSIKALRLPACRAGLGESHARWFYQQVVLALDYCHKMSISIRDVKLENTLLDTDEEGRRPLIKLCDFGYSINEQQSMPKTAVGTPGYTGAAPESV